MKIGEQIKARRNALGMFQSDLAKRANTSQRMISELETGRETVTLTILNRIASALKCGIDLNFVPDPGTGHLEKGGK